MLKILMIFCFLFTWPSWGQLYSVQDGLQASYSELKNTFDLIVFTDHDCKPCQKLFSHLKDCPAAHSIKVAFIYSGKKPNYLQTESHLKFHFSIYKTSFDFFKSITKSTPYTLYKKNPFRNGFFTCQDLNSKVDVL